MRVLLVHNYYLQPGGEDEVFSSQKSLLRQHGHDVVEYIEDNRRIDGINPISLAVRTIWSRSSKQQLLKTIKEARCDVAHFHNTFPLISPSIYYACREAGIPVVQSLHNPRILCPAATFYRNGHACEECLGKTLPWPGILYGCYRNSRAYTFVVAAMITVHRLLKTWERQVDFYITFVDFYKRKFIEGGFPAEKIVTKPHFVDPDPGFRGEKHSNYALFIGRLVPEKGIFTLLNAWRLLKDIPLKLRGDGRLLKEVQDFIKKNSLESMEILARPNKERLIDLIKGARFLVWPSEGYNETFGMVAVEAFACGVPVIASRIGTMSEIVEDRRTGLHFTPGDPEDLAAKIEWAWTHPEQMKAMGREARREYEQKYTAERNYRMLMDIYQNAIELNKQK